MSKIYCFLLFILPLWTVAQVTNTKKTSLKTNSNDVIDSLGKAGVLLNDTWQYIYQDDSIFAKTDFDDTSWKKINIDDEFSEYPPIQKHTVGWFRRKIHIDSSLVHVPLILSINIKGAAEIYLNGRQIHTIGRLPKGKKGEIINFFKQPLPYAVSFDRAGEHTLAIRFLFVHTNFLFDTYDLFPLSIRLRSLDGYFQKDFDDTYIVTRGITVGLFLMMAFIHFFFYRFFKSKRFNLPFFLSMLLFGVSFYLKPSGLIYNGKNMFLTVNLLQEVCFMIGHVLLLYAVYGFLNYPRRLLFSVAVGIIILFKIVAFFEWVDSSNWLAFSMYLGLFINYSYLVWKAIRNKDPNGKVLLNAIIAFLSITAGVFILWIITISASYYLSGTDQIVKGWLPIFLNLFFVGPQLAISGAISLGLAQEFVKTNKILERQLVEIERLAHEKEEILTQQKILLEEQVESRTAELKASQAQLIQSEKLASLGELTAGIAHEIQNPLNFVNNFSELSVELIEEAPQPPKGAPENWIPQETPFGGWGAFFEDLRLNLEKINHHGKRASSIVKGMLEHSRVSTGERALTDINQLADEYLRLSYHGLRAKDSSLNVDYKLVVDENLPKIAVIPQDIGRVLLNLINNAFYAVNQRFRPLKGDKAAYLPKVTISTKANNKEVEIKVTDNGNGIPDDIKAKIFQPFFTTKPTGEGTGLGLSLSYDIITKGHGGTLEVESVVGEGTTFTVKIPTTNIEDGD